MSEQPVTPAPKGTFNASLRGVHYDFLKDRVPSWFNQGSTQRQEELANHTFELPSWYLTATAQQKADLADSHNRYRETLNQVETSLGTIQDVLAFAEQLLEDAIKKRFNLELDVKNVYFARKYGFKSRDDLFGVLVFDQARDPALSYEYRGISLLEAALANFTLDEEQANPCNDCQVISTWSAYDGEVMPTPYAVKSQALLIAPHEFAQMCRTLDLGSLYQQHLKAIVQPEDNTKRAALEQQLQEHHRQLLALSAEVAVQKPVLGISAVAYSMIKQIITDPTRATLDGKSVTFAALKMFGSVLVGPVLIGPERKGSGRAERLVVFIPNDPQQPLKEYTDSGAFMVDLRTRLHSASYRRFFSRFVPQREQGRFFQQFNRLYKPTNGNGAAGDYPMAAKSVRLPLDELRIDGLLWESLRKAQVSKMLSDARAVAVPTDDEDSEARMNRLSSYVDAMTSVFNLAAFVVPGLGPIMLAVGAAQMCTEVYEGIEAANQGDLKTMWAHFSSVALNAAMLATGAKVLPQIKLASMVDNFKRVTLPSGQQRLWKPDLSPYEHPQPLPSGAVADELGLHHVEGKTLLPVEGKHYAVQRDPVTEDYRIVHPTRPEAYQPTLTENGSGLWNHELEQPQTWEGPQLMRRLGPMTQGLSDTELEQVRQVADVSEDVLRRVQTEGEPVPGILLDTLRQFRAYRDAVKVAEGIRLGSLSSELCSYAASLVVELPGWPASKAIEAFSDTELNGPAIKYGNSGAAVADTLRVHRGELMNGELPKRVIDALSETELDDLLGRYTPRTPQARRAGLQALLEQHAISVRSRLMNSIYVEQQPPSDVAIMLLQRDFKRLPTSLARELLDDATPAERQMMSSDRRIPHRLALKAWQAQRQMRLTQAYEGLYLEGMANKDTEALVLNSLASVPGWADDLRLEVREGNMEGELRASVGKVDAAERKVLVHVGDGCYEAFDARGQGLHGVSGLYDALQHALPDTLRNSIGLPHVGQSEQLKVRIAENALPRAQLRNVLGIQPEKRPFFRPPTGLADGRRGYPLAGRGGNGWDQSVRARVQLLYPDFTESEVLALRQERGWSDDQWLKNLEQERKDFMSTMNRWMSTHTEGVEPFSEVDRNALKAKRSIYETLHDALKKIGPRHYDAQDQYVGQKIEWVDKDLQGQLRTLPDLRANFDHVTELNLAFSHATDADVGRLLVNFRGLRTLSLESGELTELPLAIGDMPHLRSLNLGSNLIALEPAEVALLGKATRLEELFLSNNPLQRAPDVSGMERLRKLWLSNTGLEEWPAGVFKLPRPRDFRLDLTVNKITRVPVFAPGSDNALIVARTLLSREKLTRELLKEFTLYIEAAGYDPERQLPARGEYDRRLWNTGVPEEEWDSNQRLWDHLEQSFGSEGFFNELRLLRRSGDASARQLLPELTAKVWRMLEAMGEDADLREQLFLMAKNPSACEDAGALLFNAMGVEVLLRAAYFSEDASVVRRSVFNLARGKWRLNELGRIARRRVEQLRAQGVDYQQYDAQGAPIIQYDPNGVALLPIDEVEIYMSYSSTLATRLDLPWQAKTMFYREDYVTAQMIEDAFERVTLLDQGELVRDNLLEIPLWVDYLPRAHAEAFLPVRQKFEALIDFDVALTKWRGNGSLPAQEREELRLTISRTAAILGRTGPESQPGYVMTQQEYSASYAVIDAQYKSLLGTFTDQAINSLLPAK